MKPILFLCGLLIIFGGGMAKAAERPQKPTSAKTAFEKACDKFKAGRGKRAEKARLAEFFKMHWDYVMTEYPEWATYVGYPGQNARWTDSSLEAVARRKSELVALQGALNSIAAGKLSGRDRSDYELMKRDIGESIEGAQYPIEYLPISQLGGVQISVAQTIEVMPGVRVKDYEDMIARLNAVPALIEQTTVLMREGLAKGITPPAITLKGVPAQVKDQLTEAAEKSPLLRRFQEFPATIPKMEQVRLSADAKIAYQRKVQPAFQAFHDFLVKEYLPGCRKTIAFGQLPNGAAWYEFLVRSSTTTKLSPKEIHETGLSEVKRIRGEMEKVIQSSGFKGTFDEFGEFLRTDKRFFYQSAEALLAGYRDIAKRADPELARLFGQLPRLPYGIRPVPAHAEKNQPAAYYEGGSPTAGRAGYFFANTYDLKSRPKWEMEALTLHEAVPGHHLQITLAQEMTGVPEFRKHSGYTAYVEGWGLYAESLGEEMGFYKDPYSKFGQLTYEIWRAIRLVVDTGIHALGWSREKAIDFFKANIAKPEHDILVEVDRYIVMPAQALAYKIGELKIKELRKKAEESQGDNFDVRAFHDEVLAHGAVPLEILEKQLEKMTLKKK